MGATTRALSVRRMRLVAALGIMLAVGVLVAAPVALGNIVLGQSGVTCEQYQDIMSPGQVAQAILKPIGQTDQSLVGAALSAVRHAGPSGRHVTHQPGSTFGAEIDAYYRARLDGSHKLGTYVFEIDYDGLLTATDVQSIELTEVSGIFSGIYWRSHAQYLSNNRYNFWLSRGDYADEGPRGLEWWVSLDYGQKKAAGSFALYSTQADGAEFGKPSLDLTPATLSSVGSQFISVAKQAERHKPITYQPILSSLTEARTCPN